MRLRERQLLVAEHYREMLQIKAELSWLYREAGARLATCVGGMDMSRERQALSRGAKAAEDSVGHAATVRVQMTDEQRSQRPGEQVRTGHGQAVAALVRVS